MVPVTGKTYSYIVIGLTIWLIKFLTCNNKTIRLYTSQNTIIVHQQVNIINKDIEDLVVAT